MNGKKAKALRAEARKRAVDFRVLRSSPARVKVDGKFMYPAGHYRRIYQDLKRAAKGRTA